MSEYEKPLQIGSKSYQIMSDDNYLFKMGNEFEPEMCYLFQSLIQGNFRILDVGANIGLTSLIFAELSAHVDSFEPSPSTFEILQKNISKSGYSNIDLHNFGLGSSAEKLSLTRGPNDRSGAFVSNITQASSGHITEHIEIKTGDQCVGNSPVSFIKIDVEGFEMEVLKGLLQTIERNCPIVVLELNHWCLNIFQRICVPDFLDFLLQVFPILYAIDGKQYLDIRDTDSRYIVMHHHGINFRFPNLVAAFNPQQLAIFKDRYRLGFD